MVCQRSYSIYSRMAVGLSTRLYYGHIVESRPKQKCLKRCPSFEKAKSQLCCWKRPPAVDFSRFFDGQELSFEGSLSAVGQDHLSREAGKSCKPAGGYTQV